MNLQKQMKTGVAAHKKGRLKTAAKAYRAVLTEEPENPDALHFLGMVHHAEGESDKAVKMLQRSLTANSNNPSAQNNLGNVLLQMDDEDGAAEAYCAAIALDPTHAASFQNYGVVLRRQGEMGKAEQALARAVDLDPRNHEARHNLAIVHVLQNRPQDAADGFEECIKLGARAPGNITWYARVLLAVGREEVALAALKKWLKDNPQDSVARHHVEALSGEQTERASEEYVKKVFDDFSNSFDDTLASLGYKAPEIIGEEVATWCESNGRRKRIVDLGAGTGLAGPYLAPHTDELIGVDLSPKMLLKAAKVGAYHALVEDDLIKYLDAQPERHFDLAVAADTLCYFGALDAMMRALSRSLAPGAALIASFEEGEDSELGYELHPHGRYSHSLAYLKKTAGDAGMELATERREVLRHEVGEKVMGLIATIVKPAP